jgi:hypothetical protein
VGLLKNVLGFMTAGIPFPQRLVTVTVGSGHFTMSTAAAQPCTLTFATLPAGQRYGGIHIECGYNTLPSLDGILAIKDLGGVTLWALPMPSAGPATFTLDDLLLDVSVGWTIAMKAATGAQGYLNVRPKKAK